MPEPEIISLRITQASLNQTALDWPRNMANIFAAIDEAVLQGSDILALEELTLTGYECNDEFQRTDNDRILAALEDIAAYAEALDPDLIISIGHPVRLQRRDIPAVPGEEYERVKEPLYDRLNLPFNVQSVISGGKILGMTAKTNLFNDERGYEKRYFPEWSMAAANRVGGVYGTIDASFDETGLVVPFGNPVIHVSDGTHGVNLAQAICETKWVATKYDGHPYDDSRYETDNVIPSMGRYIGSTDGLVLLIPNASPPAAGKIDKHVHLNALASRYAALVVDTDGLGTSGSTFAQFGNRMIVQDQKVVSYGHRMSFARVSSTTSTVRISSAPPETAAKAHVRLSHVFKNKSAPVDAALAYEADKKHAWDSPENSNRDYEEAVRNMALWLFDYMRKTGSVGIMQGQSGGKDSAFNSTIVAVMVHTGMQELGVERFCDELGLPYKNEVMEACNNGGQEAAAEACMDRMLTSLYLASANSSDQTRHAAEFLIKGGTDALTGEKVKGIGGKYRYRNIEDLVVMNAAVYAIENTTLMEPARKQDILREISTYLHLDPGQTTAAYRAETLADIKNRYPEIEDLVTAADGVAYENLQARPRGGVIWVFTNKEGKMAVANPNLDEACNSYATYAGDLHSGTVNPNGPLGKEFETKALKYLCAHGLHEVMAPVQALKPTLSEDNMPTAELKKGFQTDESDLQRTYPQMRQFMERLLYDRTLTPNGERRLNAAEIFDRCGQDALFAGVDENALYNMIRVGYKRWGVSQHKIHAAPVQGTYGRSVDHQTSQRTPNISGQSRDELTLLGIRLLHKWAAEDGLNWSEADRKTLERRAWQDEGFVKALDRHTRSSAPGRDYDLKRVYEELKTKGWEGLFGPLAAKHPISVIQRAGPGDG